MADTSSNIDQFIDFSDKDFCKLFKIILPNFPASIYVKDKLGRYVWCNAYQLNMAGLSHLKEIQGKTDYDLPWQKTADAILTIDRTVLQSKKLIVTEEHARLFNGKNAFFLTKKIPWFKNSDNQEPAGIAGISINISDIKHIENGSNIQFIKNIQHNTRIPTLGLLHTLSMLFENEKHPSKKQIIQLALDAAKELMDFLNSILTFEKAQYHPPVLDKPFKLLDIFQSVYRIHLAAAYAKNLDFHYKVNPNIPSVVICDEFRIKHILLNLISNAIEFTQKGEIFFQAKLINTNNRNLLIEFIIQDTGLSIPKEKQDIIFEKFICLDPSKIDLAKASGFGLTNIKMYVQELKGEFKPIKSTKEKGTTFSFLIPMKASFNHNINLNSFKKIKNKKKGNCPDKDLISSMTQKKSQKEIISSCCRKIQLNVLVVEDSTVAQRVAELVLSSLGCKVDVISTAKKAFKRIKRNTYDIIFLDLELPDMNGIEMAKKVRKYEKKKNSRSIPIIGQSAHVDIKNKKACLNSGIQELLPKPLVANTIIELLNKYVSSQAKIAPVSKKTNETRINNQMVIDKTLFNTITHNDPETQAGFITLTKKLLETDFVDFKKTYSEANWKQFLFLTHKLRGSFACIAAMRLEETFGNLEEYLYEYKKPHIKKVESFYNSILTEIEALKKEIDKF